MTPAEALALAAVIIRAIKLASEELDALLALLPEGVTDEELKLSGENAQEAHALLRQAIDEARARRAAVPA